MSERDLQQIANAVLSSFVERGSLPSGADLPRVEVTETSGHWCKIADVKGGIIDLSLDPYRSHDKVELYYGFWSHHSTATKRIRSLFCNENDCVIVTSDDEIETRSTIDKRKKL